jgi:hypothetical protein
VNALLEAALRYASLGLRTFPLRPGRKEPLVLPELGFLRGLKDATTDPKRLERAWKLVPEANVGVVPPEEVLVFDGDDPQALQSLFLLSPNLVQAPRAKTGSGGFHLWTRTPAGYGSLLSARARAIPGLAVDLRGLGRSYLVAPPSRHPSGGTYSWEVPLSDLEALPFPSGSLLGLLLPSRAEVPSPRTPRAEGVPGVPKGRSRAYALAELKGRAERMRSTLPGSRHSELVRHAVALWAWVREGLLSEAEVTEVLGSAALASGLPEAEVRGIFSWVRGTYPVRTRVPWKEDR